MEQQTSLAPPLGVGASIRHEKVVTLDPKNKVVATEAEHYRAEAIILATGSTMQQLGIPGEDRFVGRGVSYCARCDLAQFAGKRVLVVGGGNTTAKSALLAKTVTSDVTLVHRRESLRTYPVMTKRLEKEGVRIRYNSELTEIGGDEHARTAVVMDRRTGERNELEIDWIVICVGTEPDTSLAKEAGLDMKGAFIKVGRNLMTSEPGVFACGEITGCDRHLINSAAEGASAGMAASEYLALEMVKRGRMFEGAKNGKYADEYLAMLS